MPRERRALAATVREIRARRALTQEQLGLDAGYGRAFIGDIEAGRRRPTFEALISVARALDVPLVEFVETFERRLADEPRRSSRAR